MANPKSAPILHPASPRDEDQTKAIWNKQDRMRSQDPEPGNNGEGESTTVVQDDRQQAEDATPDPRFPPIAHQAPGHENEVTPEKLDRD